MVVKRQNNLFCIIDELALRSLFMPILEWCQSLDWGEECARPFLLLYISTNVVRCTSGPTSLSVNLSPGQDHRSTERDKGDRSLTSCIIIFATTKAKVCAQRRKHHASFIQQQQQPMLLVTSCESRASSPHRETSHDTHRTHRPHNSLDTRYTFAYAL